MAEKRLGIKMTSDPSEVLGALQDVNTALKNVGKGAIEAGGGKDAWAEFGRAVKEIAPKLGDVAKGAFEAGSALDKLGRTGDNIGALEAATVKAQVKVTALKDALKAAETAGVAVGPEIKASIEKMEAGIQGGIEKTAALKTAFADAAAKIEGGAKSASSALEALGAEGKAAADALKALEAAGDSPRGLAMAAVKADVALQELAATGKVSGKSLEAAFAQGEAAVAKAATKSRQYADAMGDMATKGDIAAKGVEALTGRLGSAEGVLSLMKDTGGKAAQSLADLGFAVIAANQALELGKRALDGYKAALKQLEDGVDGYAKKQADAAAKAQLFETAQAAVDKGLISAGATLGETAAKWQSHIENTLRSEKATAALATGLANMKAPDSLAKIKDDAVKMETALALALQEGAKRFTEYAIENKAALDAVAERYRRLGLEVPEHIQKAIKASDEAVKAEERHAKAVEDAKKGQEDKLKSMAEVWTKQQEAITQGEAIIKQFEQGKIGYKEEVNALAEVAAKYGLTVDGLIELIRANKDYKAEVSEARNSIGAQTSAFDEQAESIDRLLAEQLKLNKAQYDEVAARNAAIDAGGRYQDNLDALRSSHDPFIQSLSQIEGAQEALALDWANGGHAAASYTVIQWENVRATEAQIEALERLDTKFKAVADSQSVLLNRAAAILDSVASGVSTVNGALSLVQETIEQLTRLQMRNMGTAFSEEIAKMLAAYEELKHTLYGGGPARTPTLNTGGEGIYLPGKPI